MSRTTLFKVPKKGYIQTYAEYRNSYRGAFLVWTEMCKAHLGSCTIADFFDLDLANEIWALAENPTIPLCDRIVLMTTFDYVMVKRDDIPRVIEAIVAYSQKYDPGSLLEQTADLHKVKDDRCCFAVCWRQTSTTEDLWWVQEGDDRRLYDVSVDTGHWFLFDMITEEPEK